MGFLEHTGAHVTGNHQLHQMYWYPSGMEKGSFVLEYPTWCHLPGGHFTSAAGVGPYSLLGTCQYLLCPQGHLGGVLVWALGWVEVVVVMVVVVLMVMVVFMPLDHRHHIALRPQHGRQVPYHFVLHHGRLAMPLKW